LRREVIRHPGSVIILPLIREERGTEIVLIRNYRLSLEDWIWELPAGTRGTGEDVASCAARELQEETGYAAATLEPFGWYHPAPGLTDERMHVFIGKGLTKTAQALEADEFMTVHPTPVNTVIGMIDTGELTDAKSVATVLRWIRTLPTGTA
jgi:ADP-ribose pyrophosphatase